MTVTLRDAGALPSRAAGAVHRARARTSQPRPPSEGILRVLLLCFGVGSTVFNLLALGTAIGQVAIVEPGYAVAMFALQPLPVIVGVTALWAPLRFVKGVLAVNSVLFALLLTLAVPAQLAPIGMTAPGLWLLSVVSVATTATMIVWPGRAAWIYLAAVCLLAGVVRFVQSDFVLRSISIEDTLYIVLFAVVFTGLTRMTLSLSDRLDTATGLAFDEASRASRTEALRREQRRIDGLTHDDILSTLLSASRGTPAEQVAHSARRALHKAEQLRLGSDREAPYSPAEIGIYLRTQVSDLSSGIEVDITGQRTRGAPADVVTALGEAMSEALRNSLVHAGGDGSTDIHRLVELSLTDDRLTVLVIDDGIGFDPSVVSDRRFGIRSSIIGRTEGVGGTATVTSRLGLGTSVRLDWFDRFERSGRSERHGRSER